jgi:hypothetical protein
VPGETRSEGTSAVGPRRKKNRGRRDDRGNPAVIARLERGAKATELRRSGMSWDAIARTLNFPSPDAASQAFRRYMIEYPKEDVEHARQLECDRLDALQQAIWARCMDSEDKLQTWAMDRALKISDQRARLLGLNRPVRQEISVLTENTVDDAIKALQQSMEQQALTHQVELPALPAYAEVIEVHPE